MSRRKQKQRLPPFAPILKEMIKSQAYIRLTNASRTAYLLLKAQCRHFDQEEVKFPYSDAQKYMDRHTFSKAINQLVELGFIDKSFVGGLFRRTNVYTFKDSWRDIKETTPLLGNYIRGVKKHTTKTSIKQVNRCGYSHHIDLQTGLDGVEKRTTHSAEIHT